MELSTPLSLHQLEFLSQNSNNTISAVCCGNTITDTVSLLRHNVFSHGKLPSMKEQSLLGQWPCVCGVICNSCLTLCRHLENCHHAFTINAKITLLTTPQAQGNVETAKRARRPVVAQRVWLAKHGRNARSLQTDFRKVFPSDNVPLFLKYKEDKMLQLPCTIYGFKRTFIVNTEENNDCLRCFLASAIVDGYCVSAEGQGIDVKLFGFNVGSVTFDNVLNDLFVAGGIVAGVVAFFRATRDVQFLLLTALASAYLSDFAHRKLFLKHAQKVCDWINGKEERVAQDSSNPILASIFVAFAVFLFRVIPRDSQISSFTKAAAQCGAFTQGIMRTSDGIMKLINLLREQGCKTLFGFSLTDQSLSSLEKEVSDIGEELQTLIGNEENLKDLNYCLRVRGLYLRFSTLYTNLSVRNLPANLRSPLQLMNARLTALYDKVLTAGCLGNSARIEPVVINFRGAPGIGKSNVAFSYISKIVKRYVPDAKDWRDQLYVRNATQEFFDGYRNQFVTMYDDFGQAVDSISNPNVEFMELIRAQNTTVYPLHMANINEKNSTFFTSRVIVLTSNLTEVTPKSLNSHEALRRRIELDVEVKATAPPGRVFNPNDFSYRVNGVELTASQLTAEIFHRMELKERQNLDLNTYLNNMTDSVDFPDPSVILESPSGPQVPDLPQDDMPAEDPTVADFSNVESLATSLMQTLPTGQGFATDAIQWMKDKIAAARATVASQTLTEQIGTAFTGYFILSSVLNIIRIIYDLWLMYAKPHIENLFKLNQGRVNALHDGLKVGAKLKHTHLCPACSEPFTHTHVIPTPTEQREMGIALCKKCNAMDLSTTQFAWSFTRGKPTMVEDDSDLLATSRIQPDKVDKMLPTPHQRSLDFVCNENPGIIFDAAQTNDLTSDKILEPEKETKFYSHDTPRVSRPVREAKFYSQDTPRISRPFVQAYDTTHTPKPAQPKVQLRNADGVEVDDLSLDQTKLSPIEFRVLQLVHDEEGAMSETRYCDLARPEQIQWENAFGTEHLERTRKHRELVYQCAAQYARNLNDIDLRAIAGHDMSKFSFIEVVGYTCKWHNNPKLNKTLTNVAPYCNMTIESLSETLWTKALAHHYKFNSHHPQFGVMNDASLCEAICDMVAVHMEKKKLETVPLFPSVWDIINENNGQYLARFDDEQRMTLELFCNSGLESIVDPNARSLTLNVDKNLYMLFAYDKGQAAIRIQNLFFIRGRVALVNSHSVPAIRDYEFIRIQNVNGKIYNFATREVKFEHFKTQRCDDVTLAIFPVQCPDHIDMARHFLRVEDLSRFSTTNATLVCPTFKDPDQVVATRYVAKTTMRSNVGYSVTGGRFLRATCFTYMIPTRPGDCGSILVATNTGIPNKILGFHCWGMADGSAGAFVVTYGEVIAMFEKLPRMAQTFPPCFPPVDGPVAEICSQYLGLGKTVPAPAATKTKLRPTKLNYRERLTKPAMLKPTGDVDPLMKAVVKYDVVLPVISPEKLAEATAVATSMLLSFDNRRDYSSMGVLSLEEGIRGVEGKPYMDSLNRTTSPGYPFVLRKSRKRGKQDFIDDAFVPTAELEALVGQRMSDLKKGVRTPTIWMDNLKDERRPIQKVDAGKTRVFTGGPIDFTIVFRMYFLAFAAFITSNRIFNSIAVGVNPYTDWGILARKLAEKGDNIVAGDFSAFDSTLNAQILWAVLDVINAFYADGRDEERSTLWKEIVNSVHICQGEIYMVDHGNPSGNPITSILNSIYNLIASILVYMECTGLPAYTFPENVSLATYGDDNIYSVAGEISHLFNQETITKGFASIGMIYTKEDKSENDGEVFRSLSEVTFLKRHFEHDGTQWVAPLELSTVLEIPQWIRTDMDVDLAVVENVECAYMELALHGEELYERWTNLIQSQVLDLYDLVPILLPWDVQYFKTTGVKPRLGLKLMTVELGQQSPNLGEGF